MAAKPIGLVAGLHSAAEEKSEFSVSKHNVWHLIQIKRTELLYL
jgi:hypothetical protein